jgi:hypothetical protein
MQVVACEASRIFLISGIEATTCVMEQAFADIAGAIDLSALPPAAVAVVAWNSLPQARTAIAELVLDLPQEMQAADFRIVTADGAFVPRSGKPGPSRQCRETK